MGDNKDLSVTFEVTGPLKIDKIMDNEKEDKYNKLLKKYQKLISENKYLKEMIYKYGLNRLKKECK